MLARQARSCGPSTVSEIADCCEIDISVVSRHLAILRDAGVLSARKCGKNVYYSVRYEELATTLRALADAFEACCERNDSDQQENSMNESQEVRASVSDAYSKAVTSSSSTGSPCCGPVQKGVVVKLAGYSREELEALPAEAVVNSFGCGNPLAFSEVKEGEVVVDLGSGAGIDVLLAGKKVGPTGRAIGIDITDDMIAKARENIAASGQRNVEVRKGIIEQLPVETGSVDWVISNCVINLSPEKHNVFSEIARVLKPGGRMLVSDIVAIDLPENVRMDRALYSSCLAGAISEEEYVGGLARAGLADVEVRERIVYDAAQLGDFIRSELRDLDGDSSTDSGTSACCGGGATAALAAPTDLARSLAGKVWSAKFFARKPGD